MEHLVEYSQAGIVLTPLGTQYPFGYIDGKLNSGILKTGAMPSKESLTDHKYKKIINNNLYKELERKIGDNKDSPLKWKTNGYVGRLLIQCLIFSNNDNKRLTRKDYNRFLYLLDIYYKTECALRSDDAMREIAKTIENIDFFNFDVHPGKVQFDA